MPPVVFWVASGSIFVGIVFVAFGVGSFVRRRIVPVLARRSRRIGSVEVTEPGWVLLPKASDGSKDGPKIGE